MTYSHHHFLTAKVIKQVSFYFRRSIVSPEGRRLESERVGNGIGVGVSPGGVTVRRPVQGRVVVGAIALPLRHLNKIYWYISQSITVLTPYVYRCFHVCMYVLAVVSMCAPWWGE